MLTALASDFPFKYADPNLSKSNETDNSYKIFRDKEYNNSTYTCNYISDIPTLTVYMFSELQHSLPT